MVYHRDEEVQQLQETIDQIMAEKLEIEAQAAEQAETCRQLTEANNTLSARMLSLALSPKIAPEFQSEVEDRSRHRFR